MGLTGNACPSNTFGVGLADAAALPVILHVAHALIVRLGEVGVAVALHGGVLQSLAVATVASYNVGMASDAR